MKVLIIHQNFPAQYLYLAPALVQDGHEVVALSMCDKPVTLPGVRTINHTVALPADSALAALGRDERSAYAKTLCGRGTAKVIRDLAASGFIPDVVLAHPGWGEALFVKDVLPRARLGLYCEYYYSARDGDVAFDPEFGAADPDVGIRLRIKNTHLLHPLVEADAGIAPTRFQRDRHPVALRDKIAVIHDGIDTDRFAPDPEATVHLRVAGVSLSPGEEVITFVARNLEPYRGYHIFMRALPEILAARPKARAVIVGGNGVSYGASPPPGQNWKDLFLGEVKGRLDMSRVHFVGHLPHRVLTQLFQVSAVHVYLTYPFVLSWSLLEAMSIGCLVVGSRTAPIEEFVRHGENGLLVDFFDIKGLAGTVVAALAEPERYRSLRQAARETITARYDLTRHCLPEQMGWVSRLADGG